MVEKTRREADISVDGIPQSGTRVASDHLLTIDEVASYLQLKSETVRAMAREGEIPAFKIRRRWRFRKKDFELWVNKIASSLNYE